MKIGAGMTFLIGTAIYKQTLIRTRKELSQTMEVVKVKARKPVWFRDKGTGYRFTN
jgi:hypothetical protein